MASGFILKVGAPIVAALSAETLVLRKTFSALYESNSTIPLPRAYSLVILVNVVGSAIVLINLGFKVSAARKRFTEKAKQKVPDDSLAELRFAYPVMYVSGNDDDARTFNCIQRGHQQPLETYSQYLALSMIGGSTRYNL